MRSITPATIGYFVASGLLGAAAVVLHLYGSQVSSVVSGVVGGTVPGVAIVVTAWLLTVAAALLLYRGLMRAAVEQDAAAERRARDLVDWQSRLPVAPPPNRDNWPLTPRDSGYGGGHR